MRLYVAGRRERDFDLAGGRPRGLCPLRVFTLAGASAHTPPVAVAATAAIAQPDSAASTVAFAAATSASRGAKLPARCRHVGHAN